MSQSEKKSVKCPQCGKEIEFTLWSSINTDMRFAIPDIISGRLFAVRCGSCGYETQVNYPLLFNDMEHDVMIWNTVPERREETEKAVGLMKALHRGRLRIVLDQGSLREKVSIFNAGLDDRVIEILKFIVMLQLQDQLEGRQLQGVYFLPGDEPQFEIAVEDGSAYVPVTAEMIRSIGQQFAPQLADDSELYIDQDWALAFLSAPGNELQ